MTGPQQQTLFGEPEAANKKKGSFGDTSFKGNKREPLHRWAPWIAGFSSRFAGGVIERELSLASGGTVLDPFCGVGTTLIEAGRRGLSSVGFEINPYAAFAARVKMGAPEVDARAFEEAIEDFASFYRPRAKSGYEPESDVPSGFNTRAPFYAPAVERKALIYWDYVRSAVESEALRDLFRLAFAAEMISFSNYTYQPSLGTCEAAGQPRVKDYPVGKMLTRKLRAMLFDIRLFRGRGGAEAPEEAPEEARVIEASFFDAEKHLEAGSCDLAVTSPPYLNNYHYVRNTRPQLYWLGFARSPEDYEPIEHGNYGKYWQTVRSREEALELNFENPPPELASLIEKLRGSGEDRGLYGGNGWANYAAQYFNDTYRFGRGLIRALRPGGKAYVVVGNSILQGINFETDRHLASVCEAAGLETEKIHTPRSSRAGDSIIRSEVRVAAAKKGHCLYESVVELRRPRRGGGGEGG